MSEKPVYSTAHPGARQKEEKPASFKPSTGPLKLRLETKGRGGKAVTVLFNLPFTEDVARSHMQTLQSACGAGATFKNGTIEMRGDLRDRVEAYFGKLGVKVLRAGG